MAQAGDTITYTYSDATSVSEDVSSVGVAEVIHCGGGGDGAGLVENAEIDVSDQSTLYIWVAYGPTSDSSGLGRYDAYDPSGFGSSGGGGSSEISLYDTEAADGPDEAFLVGAGGAGADTQGARNTNAEGDAPPLGGDTYANGYGAIDDQNRGLVTGGTTTKGGWGSYEGEIKIAYKSGNTAPSFTTGSESPSDGATGIGLDPTLSIEVTDADGDSMDVSFYDGADDTQIGSTQTGIADGGTASVTWSGRNWNTSYSWYAVADDGSATTTSSTFSFTTTDGVPPNVQITDASTEDQLTVDWDEVSSASGYYVYYAESSFSDPANATLDADVTSPPHTITGLEDGEQFFVRVSSHD